jgi:DNA gyrase subunit A
MATQRDRVLPRLIEEEMKQSFLDYSMSVIVQRALPDVRDGLKPVHRRILYSMHEAGLSPNRPFKKSATVVGDVLGKYHPHGDSAVYDAMVRMVQDFSLRYPLVSGQGNFGSIDGDSAAAYRYTEAKLAPIATEMLADIDRETVDYTPNFDDRLQEPVVLPAKLPNLLINGSSGIAVGMSTNIPPHNLREVVKATVHLLDNPDCTISDLMRLVPGPDFPTGGLIVGKDGIRKAYETGRGRVIMRARISKETRRGGREQLVVTEIPYATTKTRIIEQIVDLSRKGKIGDVADLRDESDRDGIRMVIELKRGADANGVVKALLKWTGLQSTFGVIALALDRGSPRELTLKEMLERFRDHRIEVIVRRSRWELEQARDEAHVLKGLLIALKNIDRVVAIIKGSRNREIAGEKLRAEFELTERQAEAILQMRLYRLTQLEGKELKDRLAELERRIRELEALLKSPAKQIAEIRRELLEIGERYGDARRTKILASDRKLEMEDLVAQEDVVVTLSHEGYVKQIPMSLYRRRLNAGTALAGMDRYESDYLEHLFVASTGDVLTFFTDDGQAYWLPVVEIPEAGRSSRGKALHQLLALPRQAHVSAMLALGRQPETAVLVFVTEQGTVKRTRLSEYSSQRSGGVNAINLRRGDRLVDVQVSDGSADLVLVSRHGRAIRFPETDVAEVGRVAQGVRGIRLSGGDRVVGAVVARRETAIVAITEKGLAFHLPLSELAAQRRDGLGTLAFTLAGRSGKLVAAREVVGRDELMIVLSTGETSRIAGDDLPPGGRGQEGTQVVKVKRGESVVEMTRVASRERGDGGGGPGDGDEPEPAQSVSDGSVPDADGEAADADAAEAGEPATRESADLEPAQGLAGKPDQFDLL